MIKGKIITTPLKAYYPKGKATVKNSDGSYSTEVECGDTLTLPDITFTDSDLAQSQVPAVKDITATPCGSGISYNYPQLSGQEVSYYTYDDAWIEANVFTAAVRAANSLLGTPASLANFTTLNANNAFGNTNRFTDDAGGQTYANDYVIDHYTGLGWYRVLQGADSVANHVTAAQALSVGALTPFYLPPIYYLWSIYNHVGALLNYSPFSISGNQTLWTNTTYVGNTSQNIRLQTLSSSMALTNARTASTVNALYFRKHY